MVIGAGIAIGAAGIAGIVSVVRSGHAEQGDPRWFAVDVKLKRRFARIITLETLRRHEDDALSDFILLRRGNRLSVMPVTAPDRNAIVSPPWRSSPR